MNFDFGLTDARHAHDTWWYLRFATGPFKSPHEYFLSLTPKITAYACGCVQVNLGKNVRCTEAQGLRDKWGDTGDSGAYFEHFTGQLACQSDGRMG